VHGIGYFDGTHLYEHEDPRKGYHPDWKSSIFNYGRNEVRSFLISNALFWLDQYHIDGLRVDAVASMLYLDYSREEGGWIANEYGGNENLEAIAFLKEFNSAVYEHYPDALTIAEESTAFAGVSKPVYNGGLGFGQKWMMGWMHDTLRYMARETQYRRFHQNEITFSIDYAFSENFMLPLSHDEVVHGKSSLLNKMPGDEWQKFANLRALYGYMFAHPGTKLLFMGGEFAQSFEWSHDRGLDWFLLQYPLHQGVQLVVKDLNNLYQRYPALYRFPFSSEGFAWVAADDVANSVVSFLRKGEEGDKTLLVICHFAPQTLESYQFGCPSAGEWTEIFNSDDTKYGGSGAVNTAPIATMPDPKHGFDQSISIRLSPMAAMLFECTKPKKTTAPKSAKQKK
jgi:1,4-alpha-glucan branching enzyme